MNEYDGSERRQSQFNVRSQIMKAIDAENDQKDRNTYMLMLGIIEAMEHGFSQLNKKMDAILKDEQTIKKLALNGHETNHHAHHDWVEARMAEDCGKTCEWVKKKMAEEKEVQVVCEWAKGKMIEDIESKKDKKSLWMKFLESIVSHVGTAVAVAVIAYITLK